MACVARSHRSPAERGSYVSHDLPQGNPYRKVSVATWSDARVSNLSPMRPSGQALFLMLLVGPQTTNIPGVQPIGRMAFAEALGWELEAFDEAFDEAYRQGLAKADWKARLIFVPKAIKHNLPQSPNVVKSWAAMWSRVPQCDLKTEVWHALVQALGSLGDSYVAAFKSACPLGFPEGEGAVPDQSNEAGKDSSKRSGKPTDKPSPKPTDNQETGSSKQETVRDTPLPPKGGARRKSAEEDPEGFAEWYALYQRKDARTAAVKAWRNLAPSPELQETMKAALRRWRWNPDRERNPHPATWINGRRWEDESVSARRGSATPAAAGEAPWYVQAGFEHPDEAANSRCHIGNFREFSNGQRRQAEMGVQA